MVIGGGNVAERKVETLLSYNGKVEVISPQISRGLAELVKAGAIAYQAKKYNRGDLDRAFLVIAASDNDEVNYQVGEEAISLGLLVNLVNKPELSNFFMPSIVNRGDLQICISTGGKFPGLARELRRELETQFGSEYGEYLNLLAKIRKEIKKQVTAPGSKRRMLSRVLELGLLDRLRKGENVDPGEIIEELLRDV